MVDRLRIMLINTYYYPEIMGGAEYSVKLLAEGLAERGHEVEVLCTGDCYQTEVINGVHVVRFRANNLCRVKDGIKYSRFRLHLRAYQDVYNPLNEQILDREVRKFNPDIIHTNGLFDISSVIWKVAKKNNIKVVHTLLNTGK